MKDRHKEDVMLVSLQDVGVSFGSTVIFNGVTAQVQENSRIGLIGANGAGKSTLLNVICGSQEYETGALDRKSGLNAGYLRQNSGLSTGNTIEEEMRSVFAPVLHARDEMDRLHLEMSGCRPDSEEYRRLSQEYDRNQAYFEGNDGYLVDVKIKTVLNGMGFEDKDLRTEISTLSGGEKTRVNLGRLILEDTDILLLDEPTNHLDLAAIRWLENFLLDFENTVIVVSHDRYFLNKVCTHICDVDFGKIQMYAGNYDFWYEYTQMRQRQMRDQNKKNEQKIKELQEFIQRFSANASKSKQATSRKKQLDALEMIEMPVSSRRFPYVDFKPDRECGNDLLRVDNLSKTVGDRKVLDNVSFIIHPREKVAFVGSDTVAKTTLFEILMGETQPDEGEFKWGVTTTQSYFPSDNSKYFDGVDLTLVDWLRQYTTQTLEADIRSWLGRMLFSGDEALKKANVLSGGERVRCMLCKMMLSGANVLVLDEPTNHLDLESITALNNGLIRYPETVLFTSHDHQFIQTVADRIIDISDGKITDYKGTYDEFLETFDDDRLKKY